MEEVKIGINEFGTLFAIMPDGSVRTILIPSDATFDITDKGREYLEKLDRERE